MLFTKFKVKSHALIIVLSISVSLFTLPQALVFAQNTTTANNVEASSSEERNKELSLFEEVLDYLDTYNIQGVEREQFVENALRGMVYTLEDPYSDYFTKEELQAFQDGISQSYTGIGVTLRFRDNKLYVTDALDGSPAKMAGIKKGDIITKVDGEAITSKEDTILIQGKENSSVVLTILRQGKPLTFTINRASFSLPSVRGQMLPSTKVGYISIASFSEQADKQFNLKLQALKKEGMTSLVLDLRNNLGGYVDAANNIAKQFIKNGILMYTSDQSNELSPVRISGGTNIGMPVVVLVNEQTASASEILAGALHDNGVAVTLGSQTYGKARIQNIFSLSNGSALKLTVQRYLTPNKVDFNHIGLSPDIVIDNNATAQLISGMYKAGVRKLELSGSVYGIAINGSPFAGELDVIQNGNKTKTYAQARVLSSLIRGDISWNNQTQKLIIRDKNGKSKVFTKASGNVKLIQDEAFIELHEFQRQFPGLSWSYHQDTLKLAY
ncbi:carboxyl-terminal processing protease [Paenibacillus turicensis]|uniref:Carboxyl-terminal processing protease n=1 Tax=Paenibacillus turicensis TaxID=160487 RepID=A0ABS4FSK5_9BACL|nr:S41 family peptidase [Paenibacillus turicensis]MBP1905573.1 carboxyl-terminal processing protease [Paenibacillus turicensis]